MSEESNINSSQSSYTNSTLSAAPISTEVVALVVLLSVVIVVTVIGNTLVILAVLTTRRLRTVTNCFVMSLAVADWLVGILVMPTSLVYQLMGELFDFVINRTQHTIFFLFNLLASNERPRINTMQFSIKPQY